MRIPKYYCRVCNEFKKRSEVCAARGYRDKRCGQCGQFVGQSIKMLESAIEWSDFLKAEYGNLRKSIDDLESKMREKNPTNNEKDVASKKIEAYIKEARKEYFKAKDAGRPDYLTEYAHGVLRGLLDAFYVVGGKG